MKTTADFLDALKDKFHTDSDAAACREIGVTHRQQVSRWRQMHGTFDDELCLKIAYALEIDPAYIVACMHYQRTKQIEVKKIWERFAIMTAGISAAVLLAFLLPSQVSDSNEYLFAGFTALSRPMYIMLNANPVYYIALSLLFALMLTGYPPHTTGKKL